MLGSTHAQRELAGNSYMPNYGNVSDTGGGTYSGNPNMPTIQDYERVFGPAARDIKDDPQRQKRHQRIHLPDALKGPNTWMADRIDGLISDATSSPFTTIILPYQYIDNVDGKIKWNVWNFDEGLASRVPYEAPARVLTQTKRSFSGYTVRQGLAISMEHNFMMSEQGLRNFDSQLLQMIGSIQLSNDLDVHVALITAPSYAKVIREKYFNTGKTQQQEIREYLDLFGMLQKNPNAMDILIEEAKNTFQQWNSKPPDFILLNAKITFQMTMTPEKTQYLTQGYDGIKRLKDGPNLPVYRGLRVINTRSFSLETNAHPRDLLRRKVRVAEYYRIPWHDENPTRIFQMYDESRDRFFSFTYNDCLKWARLVHPTPPLKKYPCGTELHSDEDGNEPRFRTLLTKLYKCWQRTYDPAAAALIAAADAAAAAAVAGAGAAVAAPAAVAAAVGANPFPLIPNHNVDDNDISLNLVRSRQYRYDAVAGRYYAAGTKYPNSTLQTSINPEAPEDFIKSIGRNITITPDLGGLLLGRVKEKSKKQLIQSLKHSNARSIWGDNGVLNTNGEWSFYYSNVIFNLFAYTMTSDSAEKDTIAVKWPNIKHFAPTVSEYIRTELCKNRTVDLNLLSRRISQQIVSWVKPIEFANERDESHRNKFLDSPDTNIITIDEISRRYVNSHLRNDDIAMIIVTALFKALFVTTQPKYYFYIGNESDAELTALNAGINAIAVGDDFAIFPAPDAREDYVQGHFYSKNSSTNVAALIKQEIVIFRPHIEHNMLGVVMGRGGLEDLGATLWGQTELSCFDDGMHGIWGMSYKYNERAMVFNEKSLIRLWDIAYDGYNGGKDDTYLDFTDAEAVRRYKEKVCERNDPYTGPSIIAMAFPVNEEHPEWRRNWPNPIAWETTNPAKYCIDPETQATYMTDTNNLVFASELYKTKWMEYNQCIPDMTLMDTTNKSPGYAAHENETSTYALAFQGTMKILSNTGNLIEEIQGCGHHGRDYVGVATARSGKGMYTGTAPKIAHIV